MTRIPPSADSSEEVSAVSAPAPETNSKATASSVRVVVPLPAEDSLASFESEKALTSRASLRPSVKSAVAVPPRPVSDVDRRLPRWVWGVLAAVLVVQAATFAWWLAGGALPWSRGAAVTALTVTSDPPGAPVTLDGVAVGSTPVSVDAAPGLRLVVVGSGPAARSHQVNVQAGSAATVHLALASPAAAATPTTAVTMGSLQITTDPAGADVQVDGQARGRSPLVVNDLAAGAHDVVVSRAGRTVRRAVTVAAGTTSGLVIALGGGGVESGWLTVASPVPADILEGDAVVGRTDMARLLLPVGAHTLDVVNDALGYRERRTVQVTADRTATLNLPTVNGILNVNAQPWAEVWVDSTRVGETPIGNYALPIGSHELVLRHPQLGERRQTVVVGVGTPARVGVDLRK